MEFNYEELMKTIGDEIDMRNDLSRIRAVAADKGHRITQEDVGEQIGCSGGMISKWLKGERMLGLALRIKMYEYLRQQEKELGIKEGE